MTCLGSGLDRSELVLVFISLFSAKVERTGVGFP